MAGVLHMRFSRLLVLALLIAEGLVASPALAFDWFFKKERAPIQRQTTPAIRVPQRIDILRSPRQFKLESTYPLHLTRHKLLWFFDGVEWHMRFPQRRYAYASVFLKQPINLEGLDKRMRMVLRFQPADMADRISIALLDRPPTGLSAISDVVLADYTTSGSDGWTTVSIPLSAFPEATLVADGPGSSSQATLEVPTELNRALDWAHIQELRFISHGGDNSEIEIVVSGLRFQRL